MTTDELIAKAAEGDEAAKTELAERLNSIADLEQRVTLLTKDRDKAVRAKQDGKMSVVEREELETLRKQQEDAEEARQRADGEFAALKTKLEEKVAAAEATAKAAEDRFVSKVVETAFYGATDLFGPNGRTTLTPEFALPVFKERVRYIPGENGTTGRLEVLDLKGEPIVNEKGETAGFAAGMAQLIDQWPTKDAILRGGGKTGSGAASSAESFNVTTATRAETVAAAQAGDQTALAHLKATRPGQQVSGTYWEQQAADKAATG